MSENPYEKKPEEGQGTPAGGPQQPNPQQAPGAGQQTPGQQNPAWPGAQQNPAGGPAQPGGPQYQGGPAQPGGPQYPGGPQQPGGPVPPYGAPNGPGGVPPYQPGPGGPSGGGNGLAITALILGIVALVFSWIPFGGIFFGLVGIVAIILGILGLKKPTGKGMSLTGIILGGIAVLAVIILTITYAMIFSSAAKSANDAIDQFNQSYSSEMEAYSSSAAARSESLNAEHDVELIATSSKGKAEASYSIGGSSSTKSFSKKFDETGTIKAYDYASLTVSGDYSVENQDLTCTIKIDGEVVDEQSGNSYVSCSASLD